MIISFSCSRYMRISTIIQSATLLAEFIFFLIYCVYLLEMALKDDIVHFTTVTFQALGERSEPHTGVFNRDFA